MATKPYTKTEQVQTTLTLAERTMLDELANSVPTSRASLVGRYIREGMERDLGKVGQPDS